MNLPFFIARRYLLKQKGGFSSFIIRLAIVATGLSVAVMILAVAFTTGFKHSVQSKLYSFLGHIHIEDYDLNHSSSLSPAPIEQDDILMNRIKGIQHVTHIASFAQRPVIIQAHGQMEGVSLKGIPHDYFFSEGVTFSGSTIPYSDTDYARQIILSQTTANKLNINAGDTVQLYFLQTGELPRIRKVVIAGLFHTGMTDVDQFYGLCDIRLIQRVNNWHTGQINGYQVTLDNDAYADTIANVIYQSYLKPPLTTYTIKDLYPNIFDWLNMQDIDIYIILIIMAVVAIINMAAVLLILIIDRARMIGILSALGLPFKSIRAIYLSIAGLIGFGGVLCGNVLSLGICWLQQATGFLKLNEETYFMKYVPIRLYWWHIALIDISTLIICILCMWLPTLYIRRISTTRVLQFK